MITIKPNTIVRRINRKLAPYAVVRKSRPRARREFGEYQLIESNTIRDSGGVDFLDRVARQHDAIASHERIEA